MLSQASDITRIIPEPSTTDTIEIQMYEAVLRIRNDVDPQLLVQILRSLGGSAC